MGLISKLAEAHPNIALVKYWGKADLVANLPAVPSLSITLDSLRSRTRVTLDPNLSKDQFVLNGQSQAKGQRRVISCLDRFRQKANSQCRVLVESDNNFPTAAGLASSASGFAALVEAANSAFDVKLTPGEKSRWARQGSGSAARSIFGGFVEMPVDDEQKVSEAKPLLSAHDWPLQVVVAVTDTAAKKIGSTEGMQRTAETSPFYPSWVESSHQDMKVAKKAIEARDFGMLARVSEFSCLKMHGLAMSADPGLLYWNSASVACLQKIRDLQTSGVEVFFTMDAGPQVKAICTQQAVADVQAGLSQVSGVQSLLQTGLGGGSRLIIE